VKGQTQQVAVSDPVKPRGDCFRACVCSILEIPIEQFPLIMPSDGKDWWYEIDEHLRKFYGCYMVDWELKEDKNGEWEIRGWCGKYPFPEKGYWIASVPSLNIAPDPETGEPRRHAVVMDGFEVAWDPSRGKKRVGFDEDDTIYNVTILVPFDPTEGIK